MPKRQVRELAAGYTAEVDKITQADWDDLLQRFTDANIYQTWAYAEVTCGLRNTSHLVLKKNGCPVAVAQVRLARLPYLKAGIAYVRWGPIWQLQGTEADAQVLRQAVRALRNEFTCKRGLVLRLFPALFNDSPSHFSETLTEEGLAVRNEASPSRTILMDLSPSLDHLREAMASHWKRELKVSERKQMQIVEGDNDDLFAAFITIYKEMVFRKKFIEPNDISQFRRIQAGLPKQLKMKIMLCKLSDEVCSGLICSALGNTALYLFGATSDKGMKSRGSYLLQWRLLETLKREGVSVYNLHGINPARNPGTYKFKSDLAGGNGRECQFLGKFESVPGALGTWWIRGAEGIRSAYLIVRRRWIKT